MVRTISEAIELKEYVSCNPDSLSEMKLDVQDGIMVGKERIITLEAQQKNDIACWIRKDEAMTVGTCDSVLSSTAFAFKKMVKMNSYNMAHTFRIREYVVVKDAGSETVEWIAQITSFIAYGPVNDVYKHYFDAVYYAAKTLSDGSVDMDEWTGQAKLVIKHYRQLCIQPIRYIDRRKVMMYHIDGQRARNVYSLCIDPSLSSFISSGDVPHFPEVNDVVNIEGEEGSRFVVVDVDVENKEFQCSPLRKIGSVNYRWVEASTQLYTYRFDQIYCNVPYLRWPGRSRTKTLDIRAIWRKTKSDLAQSVCRAKRMSDLAQSVCRIWRKAYVGFGAKRMSDLAQNVFGPKRFWSKTFLGVAPDRMSDNGSSYWSDIYGRQAGRQMMEMCVWDSGGVRRGWWRCV